jgi:hypothetical protein
MTPHKEREELLPCPFCKRDESAFDGNMWDRDRGAAAVAAVPSADAEHAADMLREYHGETNSWGARSALICAVGMLRGRYQKARCDSDGVSDCVRCKTMFLVRTMERLLASSALSQEKSK